MKKEIAPDFMWHLDEVVIPFPVAIVTTIDAKELAVSEGSPPSKTGNSFIPTHKVTTRLNLRPSASLDSTPVATLGAGTKIEYIHENGGWYYVNTEQHGKGWCASRYLSPLQPSLSSPQPVDQEG